MEDSNPRNNPRNNPKRPSKATKENHETCQSCSKIFKNLQLHVNQKKVCKDYYIEKNLMKSCESCAKVFKNLEQHLTDNKNCNALHVKKSSKDKILEKCLLCKDSFPNLKQHITKSKECRDLYIKNGIFKSCESCEKLFKNLKQHVNMNAECHYYYVENEKYWILEDASLKNVFLNRQQDGLSYICICCHTKRFRKTVTEVKEDFLDYLKSKNLDKYVSLKEEFKYQNDHWICQNCQRVLNKGDMPNMCHANGLANSKIPKVFKDLSCIEKLTTKMILPFIKIRELPTSRMKQQYEKIVNVAISDNDILNTNIRLPRMSDKLGTVNVAIKRDHQYPTYRKPELVRPKIINEVLSILKLRHKYYRFFPIKFLSEDSKYQFMRLPLIGVNAPNEKSLSLSDAFESLVPSVLEKLKLKSSNQIILIFKFMLST